MFGKEIRKILESNPNTKDQFKGVWAAYYILELENGQGIVCNTTEVCPAQQDGNICIPVGEHWVLFYKINDVLEYFDPLGKPPEFWSKYLYFYVKKAPDYVLAAGNEHLQTPNSQLCGKYCVFYLHLRCCGFTMENIITELRNIQNNKIRDMFVTTFVEDVVQHQNIIMDRTRCLEILKTFCKDWIPEDFASSLKKGMVFIFFNCNIL